MRAKKCRKKKINRINEKQFILRQAADHYIRLLYNSRIYIEYDYALSFTAIDWLTKVKAAPTISIQTIITNVRPSESVTSRIGP
jgi:hypothetical protein